MKPIRLLAAALAASAGLALSLPAIAAPAAAPAVNVIQIGSWDRDANRSTQGDWRRDDRGDHRRDRRADRRDDRWDRRADRRDDRWDRRDRGNHYGWDRGRHYGWRDGDRKYYKNGQKHWRAGHHPRHRYWAGRRLPRTQYVVIERYDDYYLPPPRRGHYYVRSGNDVFLIAQATHLIVDAFVLLDAASRY